MAPRIALFHATRAAIRPVEAAFAEIWPGADHWSLLDEGLTQAVDRAGGYTDEIGARFIQLAEYAAATGVDAFLFTCTAFGPAMEECQRRFPFPTFKPNEALLEEGLRAGGRVGLLASHPVTLPLLTGQLQDLAREQCRTIDIKPVLAEGAWDDLTKGRMDSHDEKVIAASSELDDCGVVLLAQFSMAPLLPKVQAKVPGRVLSSPHAAVARLKGLFAA
ncbi:MAG: aspartate/glutamate racemase family protein [Rhodospirillaceae bacterium]